jgi:hypothetical protein
LEYLVRLVKLAKRRKDEEIGRNLTWPFHPVTKLVMFILMCNPIAYDQTFIPTLDLGLL